MLQTLIVITYISKSRCTLSIYNKVDWSASASTLATISRALVEKHALHDLDLDALDLADVVAEQVRCLGLVPRTRKAIQVFGHVGQQTGVKLFDENASQKRGQGKMKQRTLSRMMWEWTSSFLETAVSSIMMWIFAVLKRLWNVASANVILISLLILSIGVNLFMSGKDASEWWKEREAARFMERLGVGPNTMMSKAVYLSDLPILATPSPSLLESVADDLRIENNRCYNTFVSLTNNTDLDAPYNTAGQQHGDKSTRATARRIRRSRQHLGAYRHDLLVAMRVVNRVETEMVRAEWENWVWGEVRRCEKVGALMRGGDTMGQKFMDGRNGLTVMEGRETEMLQWQQDYCGSCKRELDRVGDGRAGGRAGGMI